MRVSMLWAGTLLAFFMLWTSPVRAAQKTSPMFGFEFEQHNIHINGDVKYGQPLCVSDFKWNGFPIVSIEAETNSNSEVVLAPVAKQEEARQMCKLIDHTQRYDRIERSEKARSIPELFNAIVADMPVRYRKATNCSNKAFSVTTGVGTPVIQVTISASISFHKQLINTMFRDVCRLPECIPPHIERDDTLEHFFEDVGTYYNTALGTNVLPNKRRLYPETKEAVLFLVKAGNFPAGDRTAGEGKSWSEKFPLIYNVLRESLAGHGKTLFEWASQNWKDPKHPTAFPKATKENMIIEYRSTKAIADLLGGNPDKPFALGENSWLCPDVSDGHPEVSPQFRVGDTYKTFAELLFSNTPLPYHPRDTCAQWARTAKLQSAAAPRQARSGSSEKMVHHVLCTGGPHADQVAQLEKRLLELERAEPVVRGLSQEEFRKKKAEWVARTPEGKFVWDDKRKQNVFERGVNPEPEPVQEELVEGGNPGEEIKAMRQKLQELRVDQCKQVCSAAGSLVEQVEQLDSNVPGAMNP